MAVCSTSRADQWNKSVRKPKLCACDNSGLDPRQVEATIGQWENSLRFTAPRGSVSDAKTLLSEIASAFLKETTAKTKTEKPRNRRTAARIAASLLFDAVEEQLARRADQVVAKNKVLTGQLESHTLDVVLANAKPFAAVQALSFEVDREPELNRDVDAAAWILEDVGKKHKHLPIAMFLLPPSRPSAPYERARKLFPKLNGEIVTEQKMPQWARRQARAFAGEHG